MKQTYNVRISRFIGTSLVGIIQLCRWPSAFNILADGAAWFPECPGDWKILFKRPLHTIRSKSHRKWSNSYLPQVIFGCSWYQWCHWYQATALVCQTVCLVSNCKKWLKFTFCDNQSKFAQNWLAINLISFICTHMSLNFQDSFPSNICISVTEASNSSFFSNFMFNLVHGRFNIQYTLINFLLKIFYFNPFSTSHILHQRPHTNMNI